MSKKLVAIALIATIGVIVYKKNQEKIDAALEKWKQNHAEQLSLVQSLLSGFDQTDFETEFFERFPSLDAQSYNVVLIEVGPNKIPVFRAICELLGVELLEIKEARNIVVPGAVILSNVLPQEAMTAAIALMRAGAQIDLVPYSMAKLSGPRRPLRLDVS